MTTYFRVQPEILWALESIKDSWRINLIFW